jgi:DNA-binding MarR family transcriptional regulator
MVTPTYQLTGADYQLLAGFRYHIRRFLHFSEQAARDAGIEPQQHQVLLALRGQPESRAVIGALAEYLQIQHNTAVELIDRVEAHGLVRRKRAAEDRRQVVVEITFRGKAKLEKLSQSHLEELRRTGPDLVDALHALIRRTDDRC